MQKPDVIALGERENQAEMWVSQLEEEINNLHPEQIPKDLSQSLVKAWYRTLARKGQSSTILSNLDHEEAYFFPTSWGGVSVIDGKHLNQDGEEAQGKRLILIDQRSKRIMGYGSTVLTPDNTADVAFRIFSDFRGGRDFSKDAFTTAMAASILTLDRTPDTLVVPPHQQMARKDLGEVQTSAPIFYRRMGFVSKDIASPSQTRLTPEELYALGQNEVSLNLPNTIHEAAARKISQLEHSEIPALSQETTKLLLETVENVSHQDEFGIPNRLKLLKLIKRMSDRG